MSSQNSMNGEIREQMRKMKDMTFKGKLSHLWTYYKIHAAVAVAVIAFAATLIHHYATLKDIVFYAIVVNAAVPDMDGSAFNSEFEEYAGIDTDKSRVYFDLSFRISNRDSMVETASTNEKLAAMMYADTADVFIADTAVFEYYAQREYFADLENILPQEILEKYQDYLYYTDADTIIRDIDDADTENENDTLVINHHDASSMTEPVLVGISIPKENGLMKSGCYDYLSENNMTYQGYQSEAVLGIFGRTPNLDMILKFLEF